MCWTTTTAAGKPGGSPRSTVANAAGPPVDAPMTTTWNNPGCPHLPEARSAPAHAHPIVVGAGSAQPSPRMSNDPNPTGHPQPLPQLLDELGR